jgi:hypothetical protein
LVAVEAVEDQLAIWALAMVDRAAAHMAVAVELEPPDKVIMVVLVAEILTIKGEAEVALEQQVLKVQLLEQASVVLD